MLHRSFKPAKCKTALKLAASRIRLLKNKRGAQVKQLKRELAQLLESGQDQTARIRVEHVVREEKTMAAYDLLEIYCELIVARLPIIESQKNCPIDLKEAISSVMFASPRCADLPELMDVRKHFTAKYGKEFVATSVELRPDCGVSRLLVEKLSAKSPDGPTKIKILSAIAEEHNIKWNPESFGEKDSKPAEDLLNGPNTFDKVSKMPMDPYVQAPHSHDEKGPSNVHVPPKSNENHDVPGNFQEYNARSSGHSHYHTDSDATKAKWSAASHPELRPTAGSSNQGMEFRQPYSGNGNIFSPGSQNWNMEFKDATAAAQAAAESAERASMAARAAAELSSRGHDSWHYSAESQRDKEPRTFYHSTSEHHAKGPINNALDRRNSRADYEQMPSNQQDDMAGIADKFHKDSFKSINKSSQSASLKSSAASVDGNPLVNNLQMADRYSRKNSSEIEQSDLLGQVSLEKQSSNSEVELMNKLQDNVNFKSVDEFEEIKVRKQSSRASSHSRSSTFSDDHDVVSSLGGDADENPFAINDKGVAQRNSNKISSDENAAVVFDDYDSDEIEYKIDLDGERKGDEHSLNFSSPSKTMPTHVFSNTNAWSDRENIDEPWRKSTPQSRFSMEHHSDSVFSESMTSTTVPSQPDNVLSATFDDSDGPTSESEEDLDKSKLVRNTDTSKHNVFTRTSEVTLNESPGFMDSSFADKGEVESGHPWVKPSFDVTPVEVHSGRNQGIRLNAESARKSGYGDVSTSQSSPRVATSQVDFNDRGDDSYNHSFDEGKHQQSQRPSRFSIGQEVKDNAPIPQRAKPMEPTEPSNESSLESQNELKLENLTGGLRNKGYKRPPYIMSSSGNASSPKQTAKDTSTIKESLSATVRGSINPEGIKRDPYNREVNEEAAEKPSTRSHFGSRGDDSDDELPQHTSASSKERYNNKAGIGENKKSSSRNQVRYFDTDDSDSDDDTPNQALTSKTRINTGLSQRTKASPLNSEKTTVTSVASVTLDYGEERNSPSWNLYSNETRQKPPSQNKSSGRLGSSERTRLAEQAAYKPIPESKRPSSEESLRSSAKEQPSYSLPKKVTTGTAESLKTSSSSVESPSKEKASHVHPKLPDYETLTAHLQSLRKNRQ
ncbi:uncharacterized protein LOC116110317 isoform X1 [Pistacia vera]|uniref:uncharacterized protein LOC116110317 isoform X1 n=1 Tax=Pistacia vera TaxID=55513 RepID=UPI0012632F69|nr:uncharacterized protein LOC116110317 isoform X1 [Pistacia vera]